MRKCNWEKVLYYVRGTDITFKSPKYNMSLFKEIHKIKFNYEKV